MSGAARRFGVALAAGLVAVTGGVESAEAQVQSHFRETLECVGNGAVQACASFQVQTAHIAGGGTQVAIKVQSRDVTQGYQALLVNIGLVAPDLSGVDFSGSDRITLEGDAFIDASGSSTDQQVLDEWETFYTQKPGGNTALEFGVTGGSNPKNGNGSPKSAIVGCYDAGSTGTGSLATCDNTAGDGSGSNSGWVVFSFTTDNLWWASDAQLAYRYMAVDPDNGDWSLTCPNEGDATCTSVPTEVVPEPVTVVLLGSGLLGIALVARRRRLSEIGSD